MKLFAMILAAALVASTASADARTRLQDDATIDNGLKIVAIGKMLTDKCSAIEPRRIKAFGFALSLQQRAKGLGYSDAEIDAYLDNDTEKKRIKSAARAYLRARGADFKKPETFCAVGKAEISNETKVGQYLRAD
ncbi:DUF5333 domain-containing protein [Litoreibacter roseus]|nr:DUF5333 domain-containing protein [Litoreibacter roseus]